MGAAAPDFSGFFAERRFAGAKDRAAIGELVYATLRHRAEIEWRLAEAGAEITPRLCVLAGLILLNGTTLPDIMALCAGGFAPAPLSDAEQAALRRFAMCDRPPPDWIKGGYPAWLDAELRRVFGDRILAEMEALQGRAPVDLRVNRLKGTRDDARQALAAAGIAAEPTPLSALGLRLAGRPKLESTVAFQTGLVELQDEGSQLVTLLVGAGHGMQVVDLCAGAGGKTLGLAAAMGNSGQIYAFDSDATRLRRMKPRLVRAGVRNVQTYRGTKGGPGMALDHRADRVLVDAPCSGIGAWRRRPESRARLTPETLAEDHARQRALIREGARLVKPGGRLVFATCSVLPSEGDDIVEDFLRDEPGFRALPVAEAWAETIGTPCPVSTPFLLLTPARHRTDGFFVAILARES